MTCDDEGCGCDVEGWSLGGKGEASETMAAQPTCWMIMIMMMMLMMMMMMGYTLHYDDDGNSVCNCKTCYFVIMLLCWQ